MRHEDSKAEADVYNALVKNSVSLVCLHTWLLFKVVRRQKEAREAKSQRTKKRSESRKLSTKEESAATDAK